ncbi:TPA: hypothetical protein ACUSXM_005416 [Escherichia coli]|uniref:hypothetical protein n=1 Tax=Escherichia marmotae TaxID=1499973 RepID=UPI001581D7BE|nr:hypothetical protein [Escherichia marmotae]WFZ17321.1 hypothetical protein NFK54_24670 [Escherichia marmotae]HAV8844624.1 hypothetical protein [Escherichia coli]HDD9945176.1 hypothetical protein [Escherichia coli]
MIGFALGTDGFKAECSGNDTTEVIVASAVAFSLVALASAGAYAIVNKASESAVKLIEG